MTAEFLPATRHTRVLIRAAVHQPFVDEATVQCDRAKRWTKSEILGADCRSASQMV